MKKPVDDALFASILADFEQARGEDAPFDLTDAEDIFPDWTDTAYAFVEGGAVPDTKKYSGGAAGPDNYAYAGFLQGLCIGYMYANRG